MQYSVRVAELKIIVFWHLRKSLRVVTGKVKYFDKQLQKCKFEQSIVVSYIKSMINRCEEVKIPISDKNP